VDQETFDQAVAVVEDAIAKLPKTARYIAAKFKREGITGARKSSNKCPAAVYLRRALDAAGFYTVTATVYGDEVDVTHSDWGSHKNEYIPGTKGLDDFVNAFDDGRYPDLVS
jgi:hypothetical protein